MLSYPTNVFADLTSLNPAYTDDQRYADGVIEELDANGDLVWEWKASDPGHIPAAQSTFPLRFPFMQGNPGEAVDVYHINSIDRLSDGDYIVSARHLDAVFRVNRYADGDFAEGEIEWVLGGAPTVAGRLCAPETSLADRCLTIADSFMDSAEAGPKRPHDARMIGDVVTMMDNRTDAPGPSRAVAYRIDEGNMTAELSWEIRQSAGTTGPTLGSVRVASDGSRLIGWPEPIQAMYQEFAADDSLLMSIALADPNHNLFSYRIIKEPKSAFVAATLRAQAGGAPLTAPPP